MYWMMGGFGGVDWQQLWLMIALLPVLCWVCLQSQPLNLLALGEVSARQLGLPLWLWRKLLVVATGWMVGVSVALAGAIGFIGLVIPHILRLCGLSDHRVLLPACMLAGASALLGADIIARLALSAAELPIGVVTATWARRSLSGCCCVRGGGDSAAPSAGTAPVQAYQPLIASPL